MMDGYIKQQNEKIRSIKHIIWAKYGITLLLIVFILFTLVLMLTEQPPEKWTRKEIVFSLLSRERIGLSRFDSDILFTENGEKYLLHTELPVASPAVQQKYPHPEPEPARKKDLTIRASTAFCRLHTHKKCSTPELHFSRGNHHTLEGKTHKMPSL